MSSFRITLVQQPLVWEDAAANRAALAALLAPLVGCTDLVVLPEMFTTGFSMAPERLAELEDGPTSKWLSAQARVLDAAVTGSCIVRDAQGRYFNRLLWAQPDGVRYHYDKRHLFRMAREHEHYSSGSEALLVEWRGLRIFPLICYDLRFPVWSRRRAGLDYDLLIYVANWPAVRRSAWRALLPARALENQAYVVGVNRVGADGNGMAHSGDSGAWDFNGAPLAELGTVPQVRTIELDRVRLGAFRERFPAHLDADRFILEP